jgi:hypothetical protein
VGIVDGECEEFYLAAEFRVEGKHGWPGRG